MKLTIKNNKVIISLLTLIIFSSIALTTNSKTLTHVEAVDYSLNKTADQQQEKSNYTKTSITKNKLKITPKAETENIDLKKETSSKKEEPTRMIQVLFSFS